MNRIRTNKLLGIALGEKSLLVAEVHAGGDAPQVVKSAEFPYPDGQSLDKSADLGKSLAAFLRQQGFGQHNAVIGLPAKWILTRRKDVPPVNAQAAAGILRLAAEGDFSADLNDLAIDYIGEPRANAASTALLVATSRQRIDQCEALAKGAHLRLESITITGASLALLDDSREPRSLLLSLAPIGNELVIHQRGVPMQFRHLSLTNGQSTDAIAVVTELRRAMAGMPGDETPGLMICANPEMGRAIQLAAGDRLSVAPRLGGAGSSDRFAPAAAVAIAAITAKTPGVDFIHSRLAAPITRKDRRPVVWASAILLTIVLVGVGAWYDLHSMQTKLDGLRARLKSIDPEVQVAQTASDRLQTARSWMTPKPRYLACMADLTNLFPDEGSIYATSLTLRPDLSGQLSGRATNEQKVLQLLDQIKDAKRFNNVKLGEVRDAGRNSRETAFSLSFSYKPE